MTVLNIDMKPFETVEKIYIKSSCNINNSYLFLNSWKFLYANDFQLILISHVFERAIFEFVVEKIGWERRWQRSQMRPKITFLPGDQNFCARFEPGGAKKQPSYLNHGSKTKSPSPRFRLRESKIWFFSLFFIFLLSRMRLEWTSWCQKLRLRRQKRLQN